MHQSIIAVFVAFLLLVPVSLAVSIAPAHPSTLSASWTDSMLSQVGEQGIILQYDHRPGSADLAHLGALGFHSFRVFDSLPAVYAMGPTSRVLDLANERDVTHVEPNLKLHYDLASATISSRARNVWDSVREFANPVRDANGHVVDGTGVGIAIVDTGADATHPDLPWHTKVVKNLKVLDSSALVVDEPQTDTSGGHGTHVASIAAGTGAAAEGRFAGSAPGASIYIFGVGEGINVLFAFGAFDWIVKFGAAQDPPIHVVSNSWGTSGAFDPNDSLNKMVDIMVTQKDMVVLFAAGNDGGDGSKDLVNPYAKNPLPGVLGVASYNDEHAATRDGAVSSFSSRGLATDAATWPDVSAPGDSITGALAKGGDAAVAAGGGIGTTPEGGARREPYYTVLSGTSMATPLAAGICALLFQANPAITPANVEAVVKQTAYKFANGAAYAPDPSQPGFTSSDDKGAGLIDALAAVRDARVKGPSVGDLTFPQTTSQPHVYATEVGLIAPDPFTPLPAAYTEVHGQAFNVGAQSIVSGDPVAWPLTDDENVRIVALGPSGEVVTDASHIWLHDAPTTYRLDGQLTIPTAGTWRIEPQVEFPGVGYRGVDSWTVTVV